ncbi:MAG: hypothetical protein JWL73_3513 [Actinomycetia bacterium]|nr:hypothetical protein [Actinomycetes bacterium]
MSGPELSRRAFLAASGGALLLAACSSSGGSNGVSLNDSYNAARVSSDLYLSETPQRFAFALTKGQSFGSGPPATMTLKGPKTSFTPSEVVLQAQGLPKGRGIYTADIPFTEAGIWDATITVKGQKMRLPFEVTKKSVVPVVGDMAPTDASPTVAQPLGVDPICTRSQGVCSLHTVSLADVIGKGKPVAALFATPARCQSRYCGPVLDLMLQEVPAFADKATIVHVEIYKAPEGADLSPTVNAWGLESEPWLFGIDPAGKIISRLDGAFDRGEIRNLLTALTA